MTNRCVHGETERDGKYPPICKREPKPTKDIPVRSYCGYDSGKQKRCPFFKARALLDRTAR